MKQVLIVQSAKKNLPEELFLENERVRELIRGRFHRLFDNVDHIHFQTHVTDQPEDENENLYAMTVRGLKLAESADLIYFCEGFTGSVEGRILFYITRREKKTHIYDYGQKMVKCAKEHKCAACGATIYKGDHVLHEHGCIYGYGNMNNRYCKKCIEAGMIYMYAK